jgi:hypothetical protein
MSEASDKILVQLMNMAINSPDPRGRIKLAGHLAQGFGRLVTMPTPLLEQLCTKLEQELARYRAEAVHDPLLDEPNHIAQKVLTVLRIFLDHKAAIVEDFKKHGLQTPPMT